VEADGDGADGAAVALGWTDGADEGSAEIAGVTMGIGEPRAVGRVGDGSGVPHAALTIATVTSPTPSRCSRCIVPAPQAAPVPGTSIGRGAGGPAEPYDARAPASASVIVASLGSLA
jgi:hypothetical protein